ncbi:MAG TPA: hypothetical protein VFI18_04835 [Gaiellales bacterium]|nr:hypothetical protein [Gaiellales bacterium]
MSTPEELQGHYARGEERDRLLSAFGQVELTRTCEILERALPRAPATVADVGGGPGRYSLWLAGRGYTVRHRDLVQLHVDQVSADAAAAGLEGPDELREEVEAAGLELTDLSAWRGSRSLADLEQRLASPESRETVLGAARAVERVPELLGLSPHLLAAARRPRLVLG